MPYVKRSRMYKRSGARTTSRKTNAKKGLTKTEKTQVKKIAKTAINKMVESKYFDVVTVQNNYPNPIWQSSGVNSPVACWGYTTGVRRSIDNSTTYKFGVNNVTGAQVSMTSLKMNSVFRSNVTPASRAQYAIEGLSCRPAYNEVQWLLERPLASTDSDPHKGQPYSFRMIRIKPRALKASYQAINPNFDIFLNSLNEPFGPASVGSANQPVMNEIDFYLAKVNSRRYNVIADTKFTMLPSVIDSFHSTYGNRVTNPSTSGCKIIKTKHNMGKEFHYLNPDVSTSNGGSQDPESGFEPEFILFFVTALGGVPSNTLVDNIRLSARPVSTFKDA